MALLHFWKLQMYNDEEAENNDMEISSHLQKNLSDLRLEDVAIREMEAASSSIGLSESQ